MIWCKLLAVTPWVLQMSGYAGPRVDAQKRTAAVGVRTPDAGVCLDVV
jgi:hypothetical protein